MSSGRIILLTAALLLQAAVPATAKDAAPKEIGPEAGARTYAQNFKDMVLVTCLAMAYKDAPKVAHDAGSSVSALRDWSQYDMDAAPDEIRALVERYLARDYRNPLVEAEAPGTRFEMLKCLDLYHSNDLNMTTRRLVINPKRTSRTAPR